MYYKVIFYFLIIFSLISCKFNYEESSVAENLDDSLPDIVMEDVSMSFVRGTTVIMSARKIELFSSRDMQEMEDVTFQEVDPNGETRMEGSAKTAFIETDTNNVTIVGKLYARSNKDEAFIETEYLTWKDADKLFEGSDTEEVIVTRDDGSQISGYSFSASAKERTISMKKGVVGKLTVDE